MKYEVMDRDPKVTRLRWDEGETYALNTYTYACLSWDERSPLFCVSQSNNSLSIDLWRGCLLDCAYCHVQGCCYDLEPAGDSLGIHYGPVRRNGSSPEAVVEALTAHPAFLPHYSLISLCTSSTEPFLNEEVIRSTLEVMLAFVRRGLKNPFWIVTKIGGIPQRWRPKVERILAAGNKILLSICWTNNATQIEPARHDRFQNLRWMAESGVLLNWYMRPLVEEWNADGENLRFLMTKIRSLDLPFVNIAAGGLRWTEGIEFGVKALHGLPMPRLVRDDNQKTLPDTVVQQVKSLHKELLGDIPLFFKSSCAVSHALRIPSINCWQIEGGGEECALCPTAQYRRCHQILGRMDLAAVNRTLKMREIPCRLEQRGGKLQISFQTEKYGEIANAKQQLGYLLATEITD